MEIAVGATVLIAAIVLIGGVYWLRDFSSNRDLKIWHVVFPQTGGLGKSDEVQVNGVRKGAVKEVALRGDRVLVDLALAGDVRLTRDSQVAIRNVGLMGEKVIAVDLKSTGVDYTERDTIQGIYELGMGEVMAGMGGAVENVTELSGELKSIARTLNRNGQLEATVRNFSLTSEELRVAVTENRKALHGTLEDFSAIARTAKGLTSDREQELKHALDQFTLAADNMARLTVRLDSLSASIKSIAVKVEGGQGTLGKLVNDDKLYADLNDSVKQLRFLIEDVKRNPKKYLKISVF